MFISPTNITAFHAGNIKLIGFKPNDLSENFNQIYDFAKRKQIDFSILKHPETNANTRMDTYTVVALKQFTNISDKIQGMSVTHVNKNGGKDYLSIKVMGAILEAVDMINEKFNKKFGRKIS